MQKYKVKLNLKKIWMAEVKSAAVRLLALRDTIDWLILKEDEDVVEIKKEINDSYRALVSVGVKIEQKIRRLNLEQVDQEEIERISS